MGGSKALVLLLYQLEQTLVYTVIHKNSCRKYCVIYPDRSNMLLLSDYSLSLRMFCKNNLAISLSKPITVAQLGLQIS